MLPRISDYTRSFALMLIPVIAFTVVVSGFRNAATSIQNSIYVVYLEGIGLDGTMIGALFAALEVTTGIASLQVKSVRKFGRAEAGDATQCLQVGHVGVMGALRYAGRLVDVAFCPERIAEGYAVEELTSLPQIIGADDDASAARAEALRAKCEGKPGIITE